ncbi:MAG TPA: histidinol-phosphate transaminase [Pseudomonadales bacterium]
MSFERDNIRRMAAYQWGEQPSSEEVLKLNTNENPFPPSPAVQDALKAFSADRLRRYPPPTADPLRDRLAEVHDVARDNIVVTNGGDEALRLAMTTFVEPGSAFGMLEPSYSLYPVLAAIQGARVISAPLDDAWDLPRDFAHQMNEAGANLTCVVNPHAPSGTLLDPERIGRLASDLHGVLLVDEAYVDFVEPALRHDLVRMLSAFDNLLLLRTFSKGYSLAGLRLGYLLGSENLIAPIVNKTRDSYNVDLLSQILGAAAVSDRSYAEETWRQVRTARRVLRDRLVDLGFAVDISQTNFLLAEVPMDSARTAEELYLALKTEGILVRYFHDPLLEDKLRITVGTDAQNARLTNALARILGKLS